MTPRPPFRDHQSLQKRHQIEFYSLISPFWCIFLPFPHSLYLAKIQKKSRIFQPRQTASNTENSRKYVEFSAKLQPFQIHLTFFSFVCSLFMMFLWFHSAYQRRPAAAVQPKCSGFKTATAFRAKKSRGNIKHQGPSQKQHKKSKWKREKEMWCGQWSAMPPVACHRALWEAPLTLTVVDHATDLSRAPPPTDPFGGHHWAL